MTEPARTRRLYRSRTNRMVGGVAGGLAEYLQVDSTLVRLAIVALFFAAGAGVLAYIIAWIVIPEEPEGLPAAAGSGTAAEPRSDQPRPAGSGGRGARLVVGAALVAVGVYLLLDWALPDIQRYFWPAAIVVLGLALLAYGARR